MREKIKSIGTENRQKQIFFLPPFESQLDLRFFVFEVELELIQVLTEIFTQLMQAEWVSQTLRSI